MSALKQSIDEKAVNTIRMLAVDAVEKAQVGHPGMPMGAAPMGYVLWTRHMKHNANNPNWFNRDRFVLSAGHGSMLLYSLLHLSGYGVSLDDIKEFRQFGSLTPGHPEVGHTPGVDATTGPLGQGFAMAVGMALAEAHLAKTYNRDAYAIVDHHTYAICGDGDLMEGVSSEAASLAGHLRLGKLIVLYDSNDITLDGALHISSSEDIRLRFEAYGWQYIRVSDQTDLNEISEAIAVAKANPAQPTIIEVKTTIGYGSPNKAGRGGHGGTHGTPLGKDEVVLTKKALGWPVQPDFFIPEDVRLHFQTLMSSGVKANEAWDGLLDSYAQKYPALSQQLMAAMNGELPEDWAKDMRVFCESDGAFSTRKASGLALNSVARHVPTLIGGSADLASSTFTHLDGLGTFSLLDYTGRNVYFGVREFAMGAAVNGMTLHGGVKAYGGTFFAFSDYLRPAIRLSAIMNIPSIFVFTHDSIAVGEDGPTHQPVEQLLSLRAIPNVTVIRPADANETMGAWRYAIANTGGPVCLVLSRQNLPVLPRTESVALDDVMRGAYVLAEAKQGAPQAVVIATGSEVHLALAAQQVLADEGIHVRVVSMPSWELFEMQPESYKNRVIPKVLKARLAVEMGRSLGWERYVGEHGDVMGIDEFGISGQAQMVTAHYGFTTDHIVQRLKALMK
ncbi:transketolase [Alicyclobacillus fodiniaquatilis]|uniref:Transketolase n=1 Tax=Alicyclobacillus fodiniaquatilis TaxID=1661150 RepID=A0ABW4JQG6_9BACL